MADTPPGAVDLARQYVKLTGTAVSTQWKVSRAAVDAAEAAMRGGRRGEAAKAYAETARTEYGRYWREAAQLGLAMGQQLVDLGREGGERVVQAVEQATPAPDQPAAPHDAALPIARPAARPRRPRKKPAAVDEA